MTPRFRRPTSAAERALHPRGVQQTIAVTFRSTEETRHHAVMRAVLDPAGDTAGVTGGVDGPDRRARVRSGPLIVVAGLQFLAQEPERFPSNKIPTSILSRSCPERKVGSAPRPCCRIFDDDHASLQSVAKEAGNGGRVGT